MSHFSQIKTQIKDLVSLQSALRDLGVSWQAGAHLRGYEGNTVPAEVVIPQTNGYDIGFRWNGSTYELVADMQYWQMPWSVESFLQKVTQRYAINAVLSASQAEGFAVAEQTQQADGSVKLVLQRWHG
ncbi:MAG: DUF1257 domain-containing protein [Pseudanabaenaceae cyanobacterium]